MQSLRDPGLVARLFGGRPETALALLRAAWPAAVGRELARRTEVVALDRGVLRVRVPDAVWRKGLVRMRGDILVRLRRIAGGVAPRALGFVEGEVRIPTEQEEPPPPEPRTPPQVVAAADAIEDPELRQRFLAVAGRYLGRFSPASPRTRAAGSGESGSD